MSGVLVEVHDDGGVLVQAIPVQDNLVVEVPVAPPVGVVEAYVPGPQGPAGPEGPAGPGGGGDVYKAADQTFTGVNTFTGISVLQGPISPVVASDVAVRVRGLVGQTGDLQRWEASDSSLRANIDANGSVYFAGSIRNGNSGIFANTTYGTGAGQVAAQVGIVPNGPGQVGFGIKGYAGQYAPTQQWLDSAGTSLADMGPYGHLTTRGLIVSEVAGGAVQWARSYGTPAWQWYSPDDPNLYLRDLVNARMAMAISPGRTEFQQPVAIDTYVASEMPLYVRGASGQSVDLTQWQDYTGGVLAKVTAAGSVQSASFGAPQDNTTPAVFLTSTGQTALTIPGGYAGQKVEATSGLSVYPATNGLVPLSVTALAGQSVDLQTWSNSGGVPLARVTKDGYIYEGANRVYSAANPPPGGSGGGDVYLTASQTFTGTQTFVPSSYAFTPVVIKGQPSQGADLTLWQNSSGGLLAKVRNDGLIGAPYYTNTGDSGPYLQMDSAQIGIVGRGQAAGVALLQVSNNRADSVPLAVAAAPGQSASLQEWLNSSGAPVARVLSNGYGEFFSGVAGGSGRYTWSGRNNFGPMSAGEIAVVVRGYASQSANLQEWQTDGAYPLSKIRSDGSVYVAGTGSGNGALEADLRAVSGGAYGLYVTLHASQTADAIRVTNSTGTPLTWITAAGDLIADAVGARSSTDSTAFLGTARVEVLTGSTTAIGVLIRAATSQSVDLLQALASDGTTVLSKITAAGAIYGSALYDNGSRVAIDSAVVHNTGNETIAGTKTFSAAPASANGWNAGRAYFKQDEVFIDPSGTSSDRVRIVASGGFNYLQHDAPLVFAALFSGIARVTIGTDGSISTTGSISESGGRLYSAANPPPYPVTSVNTRSGVVTGLAEDSAVVHLTGAETIAGAKVFSSPVIFRSGTSEIALEGDGSGNARIQSYQSKPLYINSLGNVVNIASSGVATNVLGPLAATGNITENGNRVYSAGNAPPYPVTSVAGRTSAVTLTAADIGAGTFPGAVTFAGAVTGGAGGYLDLGPVSASLSSVLSTSSAGDKIALFSGVGSNYGFGIQSSRLVAYVPAASFFVIRPTAASGQASSGSDVFTVSGAGAVTSGRVTVTSTTADQITVLSGASGTASAVAIGRTAVESRYAVSAASADYFTDSAAGDLDIRLADTTKTIRIGLGTGSSASMIRVTSTGVTVAGTFNATGAVTQNGSQVALDSAAVHVTGSESIGGIKTFTSIPVVPVLSWPVGSINATGTPGATNVLRGDGSWAVVPMSSLWAAKGTIVAASGASTPAAVSVGTDTRVLTADSSQSAGVAWALPRAVTAPAAALTPTNGVVRAGNAVTIPQNATVGTRVRFQVHLTNTATAQTLTCTLKLGTANTNADANVFTQALTVGTAVVGSAVVEVTFHLLSTTTALWSMTALNGNNAATGLFGASSASFGASGTVAVSTTAGTQSLGMYFSSSSNNVVTVQLVTTEAQTA